MLEWLEKICVIVCRMKKAALKTNSIIALNNYVRKHIHIVYFVGVVGVFWVLLNF